MLQTLIHLVSNKQVYTLATMKILILATPEDRHAQAVHAHLKKMNGEVDYLAFQDLDTRTGSSLTFKLPAFQYCIERSAGPLDLSSYSSIWYRLRAW